MESTHGRRMHEDAYGDEKNTKVECDCRAVLNTWKVLGDWWSLLLKSLDSNERIRFNELKRTLSGISSTVLSDRLLELEREGLIIKKICSEIPPKVEYTLTFGAKELGIILGSLGDWVRKWNSKKAGPSMQMQLQTQINTIIKTE